ncbi:hypothetical protein ASA1KI_03780 [Opitutales bacterium ASA1]|nr:hypothetical protein ASA1KI_03780 [Opitutales bacterium ASA1]
MASNENHREEDRESLQQQKAISFYVGTDCEPDQDQSSEDLKKPRWKNRDTVRRHGAANQSVSPKARDNRQ